MFSLSAFLFLHAARPPAQTHNPLLFLPQPPPSLQFLERLGENTSIRPRRGPDTGDGGIDP